MAFKYLDDMSLQCIYEIMVFNSLYFITNRKLREKAVVWQPVLYTLFSSTKTNAAVSTE